MQLLTLSIQNQQLMAENGAREQQKISRLLTQQKVTNYPKMEQGADIIAFLSGFETHMDNFEVHPDQYRKYLIPALNEEGHQAIELLTAEEKADYSAKLLEIFNITVDTYRRRLETLKREQGERWATLSHRTTRLYRKLLEDRHSKEKVIDLISKEHTI